MLGVNACMFEFDCTSDIDSPSGRAAGSFENITWPCRALVRLSYDCLFHRSYCAFPGLIASTHSTSYMER